VEKSGGKLYGFKLSKENMYSKRRSFDRKEVEKPN
jgi:hypothetical protein